MAAPTADQVRMEEVRKFKLVFDMFDMDRSGRMAVEKLEIAMRALNRPAPSKDTLKEIDRDGNGIIDFGEFLYVISKTEEEAPEVTQEKAFKFFDTDQNGFISATEMQDVLLKVGDKVSDEEVDRIIKGGDLDGDGQINPQEFKNM